MQELSNVIADRYEEIIKMMKSFTNEYLNEEYMRVCTLATKTLCLNNVEQLKKGKSASWAAGVVHAIGTLNDLFDSKGVPYVKAVDLYKAFNVSSSTGSSKSKEVKNLLNLSKEDKQWIIVETDKSKSTKDNVSEEEVAVTTEEVKNETKEELKFTVEKNVIMAQQIVDYAWKQKNYKNKAKYAKEALAICEDCSDAYIILSKDSNLNSNERRAFLEKAVKAAQNVLKIDNLENAKPELLNSKIAEPFFGAKYNLAIHLWDSGEREAAIESALEILKYDEKDGLMVRSIVVNWLLIEKKYEQLKSLIEKYEKDKLAAIHYSNAVLLYKTKEVKNAEHALRRAYKRNPHVIPYILKQKKVPNLLPRLIRFGSEEEAMKYASLGLEVWNDADLIKWVKEKKKDFDMVIQN
ncbi:DUF6398 domain-containing protein [Clostridium saccharoperbutylacetonicum]